MAKATMKDIAHKLGVTATTVSRAINNKMDISQETRQKILETAKTMGYFQQSAQKTGNNRGNNLVALVVADSTNYFFNLVIKGVEDALSRNGYLMILCNTNEDYLREVGAINLLSASNIAGLLITPTQSNKQDIIQLIERNIPFSFIGRRFYDIETNYLISDDQGGAFTAIDYLIKLGHRDIIFINAPNYIFSAAERYSGFKHAYEKNNLVFNPNLVRTSSPNKESAYNTMKSILKEGTSFTAVFTFSDLMMLGVIQALREAKLRIPKDVSLVGFDDINFVSMLEPPLTTIKQDRYKLGYKSALGLLENIKGNRHLTQIVLPTKLIIRESTARIDI